MIEWVWIDEAVVVAIHDRQLAEHGGPSGVRNAEELQSALARARNLAVYEEPDASALAASYAFGIARNHPFVDGNKRTAWILCRLFMAQNGQDLVFEEAHAIKIMLDLASGQISEAELASWLRERVAS